MIKNIFVGDNPTRLVVASRVGAATVLSLCALSFWALLLI